jgi:hypothetical protein
MRPAHFKQFEDSFACGFAGRRGARSTEDVSKVTCRTCLAAMSPAAGEAPTVDAVSLSPDAESKKR